MKTATREFQDAYADLSRATGIDHATIQWDYWATNTCVEGVYEDLCQVLDARDKKELADKFRERVGLIVNPGETKMEVLKTDATTTNRTIEQPAEFEAVATG